MKLTAHWFTGLFGSHRATLTINTSGLNRPPRQVSWQQLDSPLRLDSGFYCAAIYWRHEGREDGINWLDKKSAANAVQLANAYWCKTHSQRLAPLANRLIRQMDQGYLRQDHFLTLQAQARSEICRWPDVEQPWLSARDHRALAILKQLSQWQLRHLRAHQQKYIRQQQQQFGDYFDNIESNPLTVRQQQACITDEVNNLLLAGAGTGKTSTLVGRAGYLINSGQAQPREILLLAFGNKAAAEMDQRIQQRLNTRDITTLTFHALGMAIIRQVEGQSPSLTPLAENEKARLPWVENHFETMLQDESYRLKVLAYFQEQSCTSQPPLDMATLRQNGALANLTKLLSQMLAICKTEDRAQAPQNTDHGMALFTPLFERYQAELADNGQIDFDDMITKAREHVLSGRFKSPWRYLMVDEFQDISAPRARLLTALRDTVDGASLFCVGDDWQAIYRFAGADVSLTTQFERYFGTSAITTLDRTFRFNNSIGEIASRFVTQNPAQLPKQLVSHHQVQTPAVSLWHTGPGSDQQEQLNCILTQINQSQSTQRQQPLSVYLLARYHYLLPDRQALAQLQQTFPALKLNALSIHASKGKESDVVVILGLDNSRHGFPSQKTTSPLLDALLPREEEFPYAEERRLFYVALTRARHQVHLVSDKQRTSEFIRELQAGNYPLNQQLTSTTHLNNGDRRGITAISCNSC